MSTLNTLRTTDPYFTREESLSYLRERELGYNTDEMKTIKTGEPEFEKLIKSRSLYADKTEYIYRLLKMGQDYYFLARCRRMGKSLTCSVLEALFEGKRELFEGLYIAEETDYSFEKYPVLHFNFANLSITTFEEFLRTFSKAVYGMAVRLGLTIERSLNPADMLQDILYALDKPAVILADEYDFPLIKAINEGLPFLKEMQAILRDFYSRIKNNPKYIRFFFITGVTKYSNLSIFSEMNNLTDISMDPRFAAICGYTEEELLEYFGEGIDEEYDNNRDKYESRDELVERIREYYDGYRFSPRSEVTVYNPVSIGKFFNNDCTFDNYWDQTGISSLAVKLARKYDLISLVEDTVNVGKSAFTAFDVSILAGSTIRREYIYALLYYTGYLTLENGDEFGFTLRFPDREVASSFTCSLASMYTDSDVGTLIYDTNKALINGDVEAFISLVNVYMASFPYHFFERRNERVFHLIFHSLLVALGGMVYAEDAGKSGRADEVLEKGTRIYIFELKVYKSADEALEQINEKKYSEKYEEYARRKGFEIIPIGINFSSDERKIDSYRKKIIRA